MYICVYVCIYTHMFNGVRSPGLMVLFLLHLAMYSLIKFPERAWETSTVVFSQNINFSPKESRHCHCPLLPCRLKGKKSFLKQVRQFEQRTFRI